MRLKYLAKLLKDEKNTHIFFSTFLGEIQIGNAAYDFYTEYGCTAYAGAYDGMCVYNARVSSTGY